MATQYAQDFELLTYGLNPEQAAQFDISSRQMALKAASAFADSYLTSQFQLPLIQWDEGLKLHVCRLATYWLFIRRGFNSETPEDRLVKDAADESKAWLMEIAEEKLHPQWTDSSGGSDMDAAGPFVITSFSRGWRQESDIETNIDQLNINDAIDPFAGL